MSHQEIDKVTEFLMDSFYPVSINLPLINYLTEYNYRQKRIISPIFTWKE